LALIRETKKKNCKKGPRERPNEGQTYRIPVNISSNCEIGASSNWKSVEGKKNIEGKVEGIGEGKVKDLERGGDSR